MKVFLPLAPSRVCNIIYFMIFCIVSYMTLCFWLFVPRIEMARLITRLDSQAFYSMCSFHQQFHLHQLLGKTSWTS